jgi:hypothetical protein
MAATLTRDTRHTQLVVTTDEFSAAARLVAAECYGELGTFAYQAFDWINAALFDGRLPVPLIVWELTAHGHALGLTHSEVGRAPRIRLHPSLTGGSYYGKADPWGLPPEILGPAYALDVLIHECVHVSVAYLLGGTDGPTSHNSRRWVAETQRVGSLIGLEFRGGRSVTKRVPVDSGELGPSGKPKTRTIRTTENGASVAFRDIAAFPHAVRRHLGQADTYYVANALPFANVLTGSRHTQLHVTGKNGVGR